jgi:curved DNA-binding protein
VLRISVAEAFLGASKAVRLTDGRQGKVKLPPGLRSGDIARFGAKADQRIAVSIMPEPGAEVRGDDLWMTVPVSEAFLKSGGRLEVTTPLGRRSLWISRSSASRGLFRAPGEGLPATETRPRGHLYLRLKLDPALADTPAKTLLRRFAASWAA